MVVNALAIWNLFDIIREINATEVIIGAEQLITTYITAMQIANLKVALISF